VSISIRTKHFGFMAMRPWLEYADLRRWDKWTIRIGFVDAARPQGEIPYRYWAGVDIQLLPNIIWWQELLHSEGPDRVIVHKRIVGIHNWPFMRFCGGRP
jgi:hypothetical protein